MLWKAIKLTALTVSGASVLGALVFGTDLTSYVRSSCNSMSRSVKDTIPIDFQISRARDLLADTGPEMQKNIRLMAEEEVDIATLRDDIARGQQSLDDEKVRLGKLRDDLATSQNSFTFGDFAYSRQELIEELARRFGNYQQALAAQDQKRQLLVNRQKALGQAMQAMDIARTQSATLQSEIDALDGRYRLTLSTSAGGDAHLDDSKLAQAEQVVSDVRRQLDISDRVLAQEAKFTQPMPLDAIDEKDLMTQVDAELSGHHDQASPAGAVSSDTSPVVTAP